MSEQISGREVFEFRPELVDDDDEEADDTRYTQGAGGDEVRGRGHPLADCEDGVTVEPGVGVPPPGLCSDPDSPGNPILSSPPRLWGRRTLTRCS